MKIFLEPVLNPTIQYQYVGRDLCKNLLRQGLAGDLPLLVTDLEFLTSISAVSKTKRF